MPGQAPPAIGIMAPPAGSFAEPEKKTEMALKSIELFAGAGGLAMGASLADFKSQAVVDWDRWACDTVRHHSERGHRLVADRTNNGSAASIGTPTAWPVGIALSPPRR